MVWFRVDDNLAFHAKALRAGNTAMGLWVRAGSWCAQQLEDGVVPTSIVLALGADEFVAADLVDAGLWHEHPRGYRFHEWEERQPTREDVEADRKAARDRMAKVRSTRHKDAGAGSKDVRPNKSRTSGEVRDVFAHPDPTPSSKELGKTHVHSIAEESFDRIWQSWPKKADKKRSRERWLRLPASTQDRVLPIALAHGTAHGLHTPVEFVPMLSTWLNQERWNDPIPTKRTQAASQADANAKVLERYADGDPE